MLVQNEFPAKILLFGEYSVIRGSKALAIPYPLFKGSLRFPTESQIQVDTELKAFSSYIKQLKRKSTLDFDFDDNSFGFDVSRGLSFASTIPQGYGVGSSGALCAAIFNQYCNFSSEQAEDIYFLKNVFKQLESHFHGSSSGIDPLISFLNSPVLLDGDSFNKINIRKSSKGKGSIFLLNTGRARRTEPLVNLFLEKCSSKDFAYVCDRVLSPISDKCVSAFLDANFDELFEHWGELSSFQLEHFAPMIPTLFRDLWANGIEGRNFFLKLCGAGGGGFLLGICRNMDLLPEEIQSQDLRPIYYF